jgi:hypothetical protein
MVNIFTAYHYDSEYVPVAVETPSWWRDIDSLLTRPLFSRLRKVRISFVPDVSNPIDDPVMPLIVHDILAQLPNLDNRGILFVDDSLEQVWMDEDFN